MCSSILPGLHPNGDGALREGVGDGGLAGKGDEVAGAALGGNRRQEAAGGRGVEAAAGAATGEEAAVAAAALTGSGARCGRRRRGA